MTTFTFKWGNNLFTYDGRTLRNSLGFVVDIALFQISTYVWIFCHGQQCHSITVRNGRGTLSSITQSDYDSLLRKPQQAPQQLYQQQQQPLYQQSAFAQSLHSQPNVASHSGIRQNVPHGAQSVYQQQQQPLSQHQPQRQQSTFGQGINQSQRQPQLQPQYQPQPQPQSQSQSQPQWQQKHTPSLSDPTQEWWNYYLAQAAPLNREAAEQLAQVERKAAQQKADEQAMLKKQRDASRHSLEEQFKLKEKEERRLCRENLESRLWARQENERLAQLEQQQQQQWQQKQQQQWQQKQQQQWQQQQQDEDPDLVAAIQASLELHELEQSQKNDDVQVSLKQPEWEQFQNSDYLGFWGFNPNTSEKELHSFPDFSSNAEKKKKTESDDSETDDSETDDSFESESDSDSDDSGNEACSSSSCAQSGQKQSEQKQSEQKQSEQKQSEQKQSEQKDGFAANGFHHCESLPKDFERPKKLVEVKRLPESEIIYCDPTTGYLWQLDSNGVHVVENFRSYCVDIGGNDSVVAIERHNDIRPLYKQKGCTYHFDRKCDVGGCVNATINDTNQCHQHHLCLYSRCPRLSEYKYCKYHLQFHYDDNKD